jgi:hypothetical protein
MNQKISEIVPPLRYTIEEIEAAFIKTLKDRFQLDVLYNRYKHDGLIDDLKRNLRKDPLSI